MRIGLVLPNTPAYSETFFKNKILGLQEKGHIVHLYVNHSKATQEFLNCRVTVAPQLNGTPIVIIWNTLFQVLKMLFFHPIKSLKLYNLNKKDKIAFRTNIKQVLSNQHLLSDKLDWLHFGFGTMALGRENVATAIGAKMAVSFRGYDYYVYPLKNKNCYSILFSKKVKYHVLSEAMKKGLMANGIREEDIFKITPAIDVEIFKEEGKKESETLQIKTVARLHWIKGLESSLEAMSLLKKEGVDFHYTIIGDGSEKERLQFAVHQFELNNNVTFTGKLSSEQVKEALSETDAYLQYSIQEGFCNSVLEAQAMGLLCIVSDAEGLRENMMDYQTGFVVKKQDPILLFEKIRDVMNLAKDEKQKIRRQAALRVKKDYNLELQKQRFLEFYKI